jgi:hypothetical protein
MRRSVNHKLFSIFAFALLAFAIYVNFFYKEKPVMLEDASAKKMHVSAQAPTQSQNSSAKIIGN